MKIDDPYKNSTALAILKKRQTQRLPLKLAFLDIDSTMTLEKPAFATNQIRKQLEQKEFVVSFVTSKTEEIIITEEQRTKSKNFTRPVPHFARDSQGKLSYIDPKKTEAAGVLDADIVIGSTGSNIVVKQQTGGYITDESYRADFPLPSDEWRSKVLKAVQAINAKEKSAEINPIEFKENYFHGITDVSPPDYRVQLSFKTVEKTKRFISEFEKKSEQEKIPVLLTDDSDPSNNVYNIYIKPPHVSKRHAVDHVAKQICYSLSLSGENLQLFFAGDSYPDLLMGLYAAKDTHATFLIVGKSRLTPYIMDQNKNEFAGIDLSKIKDNLLLQEEGVYVLGLHNNPKRYIILGDIVYPSTIGPETILAYLKQLK